MKVMILAAGRGERLRPLTDFCPKPLLPIGKDTLISRHIKNLAKAGFYEIIINHAWLGEQIVDSLRDGSQFNVKIYYSQEKQLGLETASGIANALPLLGSKPFLVINADIYTNMNFELIYDYAKKLDGKKHLAHLWLTNMAEHNPKGDFSIDKYGFLTKVNKKNSLTFTGIAVYHPLFFKSINPEIPTKLAPIFKKNIPLKTITASILNDFWMDIGTIDRLEKVKNLISS